MARDIPSTLSSDRSERGSRARPPASGVANRTRGSRVGPQQLLALLVAKDLEALVDAAFPVLHRTVRCDFVSVFFRSAGNGLLKERDSRGREYGPEFMRRYVELTPALPLAMAHRGIKILPTRATLPRTTEKLKRTAFYREIMRPQGWRHAVALCFWGDPTADAPVFVASVYRREGRTDFTAQEVAKLESTHPFIDCSVNRLHEREASTAVRHAMADTVQNGTRGFAVLDRNFVMVQANPVAHQLCAAWLGDTSVKSGKYALRAGELPAELVAECRELHRQWESIVRGDPDATGFHRQRRVSHSSVPGLTALITIVCPDNAGIAEPTIVLELDRYVHGVTVETADRSAPVLQEMTAAERAVAMILADGLSNQEIADRLGKTVYAVKFLLHRIYQKTGIPNRAALVAVLRSRQKRA